MINITITVDNISDVLLVFSRVQIRRYSGTGAPPAVVDVNDYTTILGIDQISDRSDVSDVLLISSYTQYYYIDPDGTTDSWYISRYVNEGSTTSSAWSDPIQGELGSFFYNPVYPPEVNYGTNDQRIIDKIRLFTGDPIELNRQFGEEAEASIHPDGRIFEFDEYGWPCSINMYGTQYNNITDPSVNGYRYLRFKNAIDTTITTVSGVEYAVDVWYYTFRNSDRQIMEAYDTCFPPTPLSDTSCTPEIYMLQTAYDILSGETWEAITEDGAIIDDDKDSYNPTPGLNQREKMLAKLRKRLDDAIKSVRLLGIGGVRID
jgi:hypothetical protein